MSATPRQPLLLDVARAIGRDVRETLAGALGPQPLDDLVDEVHAFATDLTARAIEAAPEEAKRHLPVCRAGCDSCCRVHAVFVAPAEALRLASPVRATRTPAAVDALRASLDALAPRTAAMSLQDRADARIPCPLLDEGTGACTVHPVRPLLCRGYNSCDLSACLRQLETGDLTATPPCNAEQSVVHKHVFAGLVLGAGRERVTGPLELVDALRAALSAPDAEARWLAGEPVFDASATRIGREKAEEWRAFVERETGAESEP
jgi:Fe-S-cluster containining protein